MYVKFTINLDSYSKRSGDFLQLSFFSLSFYYLFFLHYLCNTMRVLIVNTSEKTGGAAVAASRLKDALNHNGIKAKMLVRDKLTDDITVVSLRKGLGTKWHFLWERFCVFFKLRFSRKYLFALDIANSGTDITSLREFKEADVIHLSWINQGMLSFQTSGRY